MSSLLSKMIDPYKIAVKLLEKFEENWDDLSEKQQKRIEKIRKQLVSQIKKIWKELRKNQKMFNELSYELLRLKYSSFPSQKEIISAIFEFLNKDEVQKFDELQSCARTLSYQLLTRENFRDLNEYSQHWKEYHNICMAHADYGEAIQGLRIAIENSPEDKTLWTLLGEVYAAQNDFEKAENAFKKAENLSALKKVREKEAKSH